MSQVQIPNWIIVFDELELIIFVSQGLTLLTASLVFSLLGSTIESELHSSDKGCHVNTSFKEAEAFEDIRLNSCPCSVLFSLTSNHQPQP